MTEHASQNVLVYARSRELGRQVLSVLAARGIRSRLVGAMHPAIETLESVPQHLVFVEIGDDDRSSYELLRRVYAESPDVPLVALGPADSAVQAVEALRCGASEYLSLPLDSDALESMLDTLLPEHSVDLMAEEGQENRCLYRMAGRSNALRDTIDLARRIAPSSVPVLISGESGTGKELLSYLIHRESRRANNPYIRVNCAALNESLLESELFGHERGAFTGAHSQRKGRFELANSGTLLLDEISETGGKLQAELLRVLEQQDFQRLGGSESVNVNVRVICTTNRDLREEVRQGNFRGDLYYRIRGVHLRVPPLRERLDDLEPLTWHFVNLYAGESRRNIEELDEDMMEQFRAYDWPGNIRQLRNVVRTALILGQGGCLSLEDAPQLREELGGANRAAAIGQARTLSLQDLERQAVLEALRRTNSHQAKAAELLGISDRTLREKIRRYRQDGHVDETGEESWSTSRAS